MNKALSIYCLAQSAPPFLPLVLTDPYPTAIFAFAFLSAVAAKGLTFAVLAGLLLLVVWTQRCTTTVGTQRLPHEVLANNMATCKWSSPMNDISHTVFMSHTR
jgi:hypothetical protein